MLADFLDRIEGFMRRHGVSQSRLGLLALNDPSFITHLRAGRDVRMSTAEKLQAYMDEEDRRAAAASSRRKAASKAPRARAS